MGTCCTIKNLPHLLAGLISLFINLSTCFVIPTRLSNTAVHKKGGEFQQKSFVKKFVKLKSDLQCYARL